MTLQDVQAITADEKGIIVLIKDGVPRRFMKEKLISILIENQHTPDYKLPNPKIKTPKTKHRPREKKAIGRPRVRFPKAKKELGETRRIPVIAVLPDGTEQRFESRKLACDALGIAPGKATNISKVIKGEYRHVAGIKFKNAENLTANHKS